MLDDVILSSVRKAYAPATGCAHNCGAQHQGMCDDIDHFKYYEDMIQIMLASCRGGCFDDDTTMLCIVGKIEGRMNNGKIIITHHDDFFIFGFNDGLS
jgi:hypothetical protein